MSPQAAVALQNREINDIFFNTDAHYTGPDEHMAAEEPTPGFFQHDGDGMMPQGMASATVRPGYDEPDNATW